MKNFIFKSTDADLQKMFSILENLQKNILYVTYRVDDIHKKLIELINSQQLQKQVDEYFDDKDKENIPEE